MSDGGIWNAPGGIRTHKPGQAAAWKAAVFTNFTTDAQTHNLFLIAHSLSRGNGLFTFSDPNILRLRNVKAIRDVNTQK